jgi:hypothetical protein
LTCFQGILLILFLNLKPCGIADLNASTASDTVWHRQLERNDIFLVSAETWTIAQLSYDYDGSQVTPFPVRAVIFLIAFIPPDYGSAARKIIELEPSGPLARHQMMYPFSSLSVKKNPNSILKVLAIICRVAC